MTDKIFPEIEIHNGIEEFYIRTTLRKFQDDKWWIWGVRHTLYKTPEKEITQDEINNAIMFFIKKAYLALLFDIMPVNENQIVDADTGIPLFKIDTNQISEKERLKMVYNL